MTSRLRNFYANNNTYSDLKEEEKQLTILLTTDQFRTYQTKGPVISLTAWDHEEVARLSLSLSPNCTDISCPEACTYIPFRPHLRFPSIAPTKQLVVASA